MKLQRSILLASLLSTLLLPGIGSAGVELYTGTMDVVTVSGSACDGLTGVHAVSLIIRQDDNGSAVSGYFGGKGIITGRFSGSDRARLAVSYPYQDKVKSTGHFLSITTTGKGLSAELRDRHIESTVEDCNFDLARLTLTLSGVGELAENSLRPMAGLFDAQLMRSEAFNLSREGQYESALPLFLKALALAEPLSGNSDTLLIPYVTGLANAYVKLGRFDEFNRLYDERIDSIKDQTVRAFFAGYRAGSLLGTGREQLARDEYPAALESFQKALLLQPQSKEAIAAVMSVHLRKKDFDSAILFLEGALKNMEKENGRMEVRGALAYVYSLRSKKYEKDGKDAEAEADLKKADALDPYSVQYLIALARLRHKAGSLAEAEKILQKGLERFQNKASNQEIITARDRMRQTEAIMKKLRSAGG